MLHRSMASHAWPPARQAKVARARALR